MLDGEPGTQVRAAAGSRSEGHTGWAAPCLVVRPSHLAPSCPCLAPGAQHPPPQNAPPAPTTLPTAGVHLPGWSLGFVTEQLTRSIPLEEKQLEPSYFSLSVAPQALGVFTLNSRPAERIYNLIMEF